MLHELMLLFLSTRFCRREERQKKHDEIRKKYGECFFIFCLFVVCCRCFVFFTCKMVNQTPVGDSSSLLLHSIDPVVDCMEV